jgi:hypothetical protein
MVLMNLTFKDSYWNLRKFLTLSLNLFIYLNVYCVFLVEESSFFKPVREQLQLFLKIKWNLCQNSNWCVTQLPPCSSPILPPRGVPRGDAQDARAPPPPCIPPPPLCTPPPCAPPLPSLKGWLWGGGRTAKNVHPPRQNPRYAPDTTHRSSVAFTVLVYRPPFHLSREVYRLVNRPRCLSADDIWGKINMKWKKCEEKNCERTWKKERET